MEYNFRMRYGLQYTHNRTNYVVGSMISGMLHENTNSLANDLERQCSDLKLLRDWEITANVYQERNKGAVIPKREDLEETIQWFESAISTWRSIGDNL